MKLFWRERKGLGFCILLASILMTLALLRIMLFHSSTVEKITESHTRKSSSILYSNEWRFFDRRKDFKSIRRAPPQRKQTVIYGGSHYFNLLPRLKFHNEDVYFFPHAFLGVFQILTLLNEPSFSNMDEVIYLYLPLDLGPLGENRLPSAMTFALEDSLFLLFEGFSHFNSPYRNLSLFFERSFVSIFPELQTFGIFESFYVRLFDTHPKIQMRRHVKRYLKHEKVRIISDKTILGLLSRVENNPGFIEWQMAALTRFAKAMKAKGKKLTVVSSHIRSDCETPAYKKIEKMAAQTFKELEDQKLIQWLSFPPGSRIKDAHFSNCNHFKKGSYSEKAHHPLSQYLLKRAIGTGIDGVY